MYNSEPDQGVKGFYMRLMDNAAPSLPMANSNVIKRGPVLSHEQQLQLCRAFTAQEIKEALFSIASHKAPGLDGYNVYFFKKVWTTIGGDVIEVVQHFFQSGSLPPALNTTLLSLLPKSASASSIKEYRPIACCSILYKIISKAMDNIL